MTKYMIENTFWVENVLHKTIFSSYLDECHHLGLDSLTDGSSFCIEKWQQLWSLPVQLWHVDSSDMPLILRNSSQICKEKYTILVTYQKWYAFFCDLNMSFGYKLVFNQMKIMDSVKQ